MLATKKKTWMLGAVALVAGGLAYARAAETAKGDASRDADALVSAAQKFYAQLIVRFRNGEPVNVDDVYQWSRRLADAVIRANPSAKLEALQSHEKRMQDVRDTLNGLVRQGLTVETGATDYYLLEAKILVSDASNPNP